MQACFIGHRSIEKNEELISSLNETVITLIQNGVTTFFFGSKSEFDNLSWEIVTKLKKQYPFIKRVYVRATYQNVDKSYENYLLKSYEYTYFPPKLKNGGKYAYIKRNYDMIDNSTYCVFYYNENYIVPLKKKSKTTMLFPQKHHSGTKIAYEYAQKRKKEIINLYKRKD